MHSVLALFCESEPDCYNTIHDDGFLQEECGTQQRQRCSRLPRMGRGSTLMEVNEFDSIRLRFIE